MQYEALRIDTIYALIDPRNGAIRYVGYTRTALGKRLSQHVRQARFRKAQGGNYRAINWISSLTQIGLHPVIIPLETFVSDWAERERFWINLLRTMRNDLTNTRNGGGGGPKSALSTTRGRSLTPATRRKLSDAAKARYANLNERMKASRWMAERVVTEETKTKLRKTHCPQGHKYTEANTVRYIGATGKECRTCRRERSRNYNRASRGS
jgi:hypothetical protein